jgi:hypothetical protein
MNGKKCSGFNQIIWWRRASLPNKINGDQCPSSSTIPGLKNNSRKSLS